MKSLLLAGALALGISSAASAAIVVDQSQAAGNLGLAGVSGTSHPLQSFQTSAGNIAGGGFYIHGASGGSLEFTIAVWDALPDAMGATQLAFGTATATDDSEQWIDAFWTPIALLSATTYYLTIDVAGGTAGASVAGVFRGNPYTDGELFLDDAGSVGYQTYASDTKFRTYADVQAGIPEPATWALMIMGFGAVGGMLRRRQYA